MCVLCVCCVCVCVGVEMRCVEDVPIYGFRGGLLFPPTYILLTIYCY